MKISAYSNRIVRITLTNEDFVYLTSRARLDVSQRMVITQCNNSAYYRISWDAHHGVQPIYNHRKNTWQFEFYGCFPEDTAFNMHEPYYTCEQTESEFPYIEFTLPSKEQSKEMLKQEKERIGIARLKLKLKEAEEIAEELGLELKIKIHL